MMDIKLVVKIDAERYESIKKHNGIPTVSDGVDAADAILNGTPLPKGHGRLIDENIVGYPCVSEWKIEGLNTTVGHILSMQPTIIEADTESEG